MPRQISNIGASIRGRLLNLARERNQPFDLLLTRFAHERFLYRLSLSQYRQRFALKGAMLMTTWFDDPHRPTRDLDLLGFGDPSPEVVLSVFREICAISADDAVIFDIEGATVERIRDDAQYDGLRIKAYAHVDGARVRIVVDIGFGDATEPGLSETELPVLLDFPPPRLRSYVRETVIAEKFEAMVVLGRANSRMKDLYDVWLLAQAFEFNDDKLARAIAATFERRKTPIPEELPDGLTLAFAEDPSKIQQWSAFIDSVATKPGPLTKVVDDLAAFLMPHANAARKFQDQDS